MTYSSRNLILCLLVTSGLIGLEWSLVHSVAFVRRPGLLSGGVLFDLTVLPTLLFYRMVARPQGWSRSRMLVVGLLMLRIALFILPETGFASSLFNWPMLLALTEGGMLLIALFRIRTIAQTYRRLRPITDPATALLGSLTPVFGKQISTIFLSEGRMLYYTLLGWRLQPDLPATARALTTHRESGQIALFIALGLGGIVEMAAVHLPLARWSPTVAWWVTGLSGYSLLLLLAEAVATLKRPSYLLPNALQLRLGIRWRATIDRNNIATLTPINDKPILARGLLNGPVLTAPNLLLTLHKPVRVDGPYGLTKTVDRITLFVDDRATLIQALRAAL